MKNKVVGMNVYGQWYQLTAESTFAHARKVLKYGYDETRTVLRRRGEKPVGRVRWITHYPDEVYRYGTLAWRQTFTYKVATHGE